MWFRSQKGFKLKSMFLQDTALSHSAKLTIAHSTKIVFKDAK